MTEENLKQQIEYVLLEKLYAERCGIKDDGEYNENLRKILPNDWYLQSTNERTKILEEALSNQIDVFDTKLYQKDGVIR